MVEESVEQRSEFLTRLRLFMDMTLEDLRDARESKEADMKEIQAIRSVALKLARMYDRATANTAAGRVAVADRKQT